MRVCVQNKQHPIILVWRNAIPVNSKTAFNDESRGNSSNLRQKQGVSNGEGRQVCSRKHERCKLGRRRHGHVANARIIYVDIGESAKSANDRGRRRQRKREQIRAVFRAKAGAKTIFGNLCGKANDLQLTAGRIFNKLKKIGTLLFDKSKQNWLGDVSARSPKPMKLLEAGSVYDRKHMRLILKRYGDIKRIRRTNRVQSHCARIFAKAAWHAPSWRNDDFVGSRIRPLWH